MVSDPMFLPECKKNADPDPGQKRKKGMNKS